MKRYFLLLASLFFIQSIYATFWLTTRETAIAGSRTPGDDIFTLFSFDIDDTAATGDSPDAAIATNIFSDRTSAGCLESRIINLTDIKMNMWSASMAITIPGASFIAVGDRGELDYRSNLLAVRNGNTMALLSSPEAYSTNGCPPPQGSSDIAWGLATNFDGTPRVLTTMVGAPPTVAVPGLKLFSPEVQSEMASIGQSSNALVAFVDSAQGVYASRRTGGSWGDPLALFLGGNAIDTTRNALDNNGNGLVVFSTINSAGSVEFIRSAYIDTTGNEILPLAVDTSMPGQVISTPPFLAMNRTSGNAFALWKRGSALYTNFFNASMKMWEGAQVLRQNGSINPLNNYDSDPIAMNNQGHALAIWDQSGILQGSFYNGSEWETPLEISRGDQGVSLFDMSVSMDDAGNAVACYVDSSNVPYSAFYVRDIKNQDPPQGQWLQAQMLPIDDTNLARARMNNNTDAMIGVLFSGNDNFFATVNKKLTNQIVMQNVTQNFAGVPFTKMINNSENTPLCSTVENTVAFMQEGRVNRFATQSDCFNVLTWNKVSGVNGYRIFRNGDPIATFGPKQKRIYEDHNQSKSFTDTYSILFLGDQGNTRCNQLTWDLVTDATAYTVCRDGMEIAALGDSATSFQDCNISDAQDCDSFTYVIKATIPLGQEHIMLSWDAVAGAHCYRVYRTMQDNIVNPKENPSNVCCFLSKTEQTSYLDTSPDTSCTGYTVVAVDANGCEVKNVVNWMGSTDGDVIGYNIYKDGVNVANVPGTTGDFSWTDPDSPSAVHTYIVVAQCSTMNTNLGENIEAMPLQGGMASMACNTDPFASDCSS